MIEIKKKESVMSQKFDDSQKARIVNHWPPPNLWRILMKVLSSSLILGVSKL